MNVGFICVVEDLLNELWRDEIHALAVTNDQITWHHGHATDAHWNVNSSQHYIADWGGIDRLEIGRHIDGRKALQIPHAAINY